ncbi:MAG: bifunctional demethylmenaquinone methyltransferase/2-methoxy-6-polyprenyl-1,4-benzoquinol methylase UbiE [Betaproteobacteria bacterium]|nr:bifunctional demethylmenaquinone methyltransferase/2-methoxy-6-polyprenyl-1,4-benzoquinol methylase UbiE [Betaproteobacteria bacterium]
MSSRPGDAHSRTHFGFQRIAETEKAKKVADVFDSVADRYDLMNDIMSGGLHRLWKFFTVAQSGIKPGDKILDIAGGTGDLALAFAKKAGADGTVILTDINHAMLTRGRDRLLDKGFLIPAGQCDAEALPFKDNVFDCVSVSFGLRNMTRKEKALAEMRRVLKPGGCLLILEFSQIWKPLAPFYDLYSFKVIPRIGQLITGDAESYLYLAESIRMHPDQETLKKLIESAGLEKVEYFNLTFGAVALHRAQKPE